jgi:hypothetical protein
MSETGYTRGTTLFVLLGTIIAQKTSLFEFYQTLSL